MKKLLVITLTLCLLISCSIASCYAATSGTYEYNDFTIINTNGGTVSAGAFRSDNSALTSFTIDLWQTSEAGAGHWTITGGTYTNLPAPTGKVVDWDNITSTGYAMVNGSRYPIVDVDNDHYFVRNIPAGPYYYPVTLYIPYIDGGGDGIIPPTPTLGISNGPSVGSLYWSPTGYSVKILYSSDSHVYNQLADNVTDNNYIVTDEGYYRIQLHYTEDGVSKLTDTSNVVEFVKEDAYDDTPLGKIWQMLSNIIDGLTEAKNTIVSFVQTLGEMISVLWSWLPDEIGTVFIAVVVVGLVLGLFLK